MAFGNVTVGQTKDLSPTLSNSGTVSLTVYSVTVSGAGFTLVSPAGPFTISPGNSQAATVRFAPATAGTQSGTLIIGSSDPNSPSLTVSLTGAGVALGAPALSLSANALAFSSVTVGQTKDLSVTLSNGGTAPLTVNSVTVSGAGFTLVTGAGPFTIAPAGAQTTSVRFAPFVPGTQGGTLTIASNDPNRPNATVSLTGTGVASSPGKGGPVDISAAFNRIGIYRDGSLFSATGGFDNRGNAHSAEKLGSVVSWKGNSFNLGPGTAWFDTSAFRQPAAGTHGSAGVGVVRGPGQKNFDLSLKKGIPLTESMRLEFRAEFFNLSNTPLFNSPNRSAQAATFGEISSAQGERHLQLALKFYF